MIRDQELTISDEELFTSSAYQKYLTSMAKSATGRYRQGLQALMEWDARADAGIAHTDNYKIHINAVLLASALIFSCVADFETTEPSLTVTSKLFS